MRRVLGSLPQKEDCPAAEDRIEIAVVWEGSAAERVGLPSFDVAQKCFQEDLAEYFPREGDKP